MSDPEAARNHHLQTTANAVLATVRRDGTPNLTPNWYLWTGDKVLISTPNWTDKIHNIRHDPRVSVCIDDPVTGSYVTIYGVASIITGDAVKDLTFDLLRKYRPESEVLPHWERINQHGERVIIEVAPKAMRWRRGY